MIQLDRLPALGNDPLMSGHHATSIEHTTSDARRDTRTFLPMNRAGTEYFPIRTVTIEDLLTLGVNTRPGSNSSAGNAARNGCSAAKSWPMVWIRSLIRRASSLASHSRIRSLSSSKD
ncbi:UNVERIFIED_ORG: hypothetical protein ABIB52_001865 [Arthrobacter sp. UYCu721]